MQNMTYAILMKLELPNLETYSEETLTGTQTVVRLDNGYGVSVVQRNDGSLEAAAAFWPHGYMPVRDWEFYDRGAEQSLSWQSEDDIRTMLVSMSLLPALES